MTTHKFSNMTHAMPSELRRFVDFLAANPSPVDVVEGKFYMVPCVAQPKNAMPNDHPAYVPLIGTVHEDRDVIGFDPWHVHVDTRFITYKRHYLAYRNLGYPVSLTNHPWLTEKWPEEELNPWAYSELSVRRFKARRSAPPWMPPNVARWQRDLEDAYAGASAACGVCPHRQLPLAAGRDVGNGVRQCSGHGLCWNRDGRMVRQVASQAVQIRWC